MNQKSRRVLSALAIAYCSVVFGGCSVFRAYPQLDQQLDRWEEYFSSGREAFTNGHYPEAEKRFSLSLKEAEKFDPHHGRQADSLEWLAKACLRQGKFQQAASFCNQAVKISESSTDPSSWDLADRLTSVAEIYRTQRKCRDAEPLLRRALSIYEKHFDENVIRTGGNWTGLPLLAAGMINLAVVLEEQNKSAEAEMLFKRALKLEEASIIGNDSENPDLILDISMQASLYRKQNRNSEAEAFLYKSLENTYKMEKSGSDVAIRLNNIAALYFAEGKYDQAEPLLKDSLKASQAPLGTSDPTSANIQKNLAEVYMAQSKYTEAEPLLKSALAMTEQTLGANHPDVANILDNYAALLRKTNRPAEAEKLEARARFIRAPQT